MDQYLGVDLRDRKGEPAHALHRLHHKLYTNLPHKGHVYYVLVCSVALGDPSRTRQPTLALARA